MVDALIASGDAALARADWAKADFEAALALEDCAPAPSLSWDGRTLLFGLAPGPEGMSDIYISTR